MPAAPEAELGGIADGLDNMEDIVAQAAQDVVPLITQDLQQKYSAESAPDGSPWAQRVRQYRWAILDRSGALKGSLVVKANGEDIDISYQDEKASYHQDGTGRIAQRKLVPEGEEDFPPQWSVWIEQAVEKRIMEMLEQLAVEL